MLSLNEQPPGPLWLKSPPVSFNIYSSTNPDMVAVFYFPLKDAYSDSYKDNNLETFKKQLVDLKILKGEVKSMDYIDDEDDVIRIDSEHEFMEALKFARAYKEKTGQSVFLLIDEKSEEEVTESAMIPSDDDPAESIVEEVMGTRKITHDKSKRKGFAVGSGLKARSLKEKRRYKSAKVDDKLEPSACCQKYLEKFKQEIVAEVTKNVMKKVASAFNIADLDVDAAKETPEEETCHQPDAGQSCSISDTKTQAKHIENIVDSPKKRADILSEAFHLESKAALLRLSVEPRAGRPITYAETAAKDKTLDREYSIHKVPNYPHHPASYGPNPLGRYFPSLPMVPPFYSSYNPMPYIRPGSIMGPSGLPPFPSLNSAQYLNDYMKQYAPICRPSPHASVPAPAPALAPAPAPAPAPASPSAEEKNGDSQKKKPKITDYVVLNRDDLTEEQKNLLEQAKKIKFKKSNALEIKSTIKKMTTPSPKKSSSSKIKNKNKMEKELMMNVKKMYNIKIDDQVQKTSGCKRKSRSTDEILNLWATRCSLLNHVPGTEKFNPERALNSNLENLGIYAWPPSDSVKGEDREAKVVKDAVEDKEIEDNDEKNFDQDEQSSSDDASTLSETSNLSIPSETNNFELVYYDKDTNDFGIKDDKPDYVEFMKKYSPAVFMSAGLGWPATQSGNKIKEVENEASTGSGSKPLKQSDEPKKEVRFEVEVEDIGPDESEELIPELNKRSGGGYSFVSETLPKAEESITESTASADEKNTEKEKSSQQSQEQSQQSSEFNHQRNLCPSLSQLNAGSSCETQYPEKPTTGTKSKSEKKSKDKESQQKRPSYSETVPNVSAHCFVMKSSAENVQASKLLKADEKLKKAEKQLKEYQKKCKEAEKKSKSAQDQSSRSKTARDDYVRSSFCYPEMPTNKPGYPPHPTNACYSSAKSSPKHNYPYVCEPPRNFFSLYDPGFVDLPPTASKPRLSFPDYSEPMPVVFPPPSPYPPNMPPLTSNTRPNPLGPSATDPPTNLGQGFFPRPPPPFNPCHIPRNGMMYSRNPGSDFDPSQSFPDTIAHEAATQAFVHARQAVSSYIKNQLNNNKP
ncbi:uncharacterized protein LOC130678467 [Microplitis mediator]|uniref:uncharacterized protein LOC130678467 n=1 Tax=Microplitis mediator TaxID=375433 RepID=UPI002554C528|nr:uncharacterized protein LOC130678467 [Microplitis mediator]